MIDLTKTQAQNVADNLDTLVDKDLNYKTFKIKLNKMGIKGSDEDIKAFKEQIKELVSKKGELSKMSEKELAQAVGGVNWKKSGKIAGITVGSIIMVVSVFLAGKNINERKYKDEMYDNLGINMEYDLL